MVVQPNKPSRSKEVGNPENHRSGRIIILIAIVYFINILVYFVSKYVVYVLNFEAYLVIIQS